MAFRVVFLLSATAAMACASADWARFPFKAESQENLITDKTDGLPDYRLDNQRTKDKNHPELTPSTSPCPPELQATACGHFLKQDCVPGGGGVMCIVIKANISAHPSLAPDLPMQHAGQIAQSQVVPRTRQNILERAVGWLAMNVPYMGHGTPSKSEHQALETCGQEDNTTTCPQFLFTNTCEGLISMAWGVPGYGGNIYSRKDPQHDINGTLTIDYKELMPGDALRMIADEKCAASHYWMFRSWVNGTVGGSYNAYQMSQPPGNMNRFVRDNTNDTWCDPAKKCSDYPCVVPTKYPFVVEADTVTA